jgi:hypothetical protein
MSKPINLIFAIAFIWLALIPLACSQPPVTTVQYFPDGYTTIGSQQEYLKQGQDYQYNFFVENASNGALITNETINCTFYMADSTGEVKVFSDVPYFPDGHWGIDIDGANFSDVGIYCYGVRCSDGFGGHVIGCWEVTPSGMILSDSDSNIANSSIYFLLALGLALMLIGVMFLDRSFWERWIGVFLMIFGFVLIYYDLSMVNFYINNMILNSSTTERVFILFTRTIKIIPYVIALIIGFAIVKLVRVVIGKKDKGDGWDNNKYD